MGALLDQVVRPASLTKAWEQVLANDMADDLLSPGVRRFAERAEATIAEMSQQLATGRYTPRPLTEVVIAKDDGGERVLRIPAVPDRVVERALLTVLTPQVDPWLGPASFAFRPGLGVADAVRELARRRDEGYQWVLRTDIDNCFLTVDVRRAHRCLTVLIDDAELLAVVDLLLHRTARRPGTTAPVARPGVGPGFAAVAAAGQPRTRTRRRTTVGGRVPGHPVR
jgi:CRISPR-associated protein Cas1